MPTSTTIKAVDGTNTGASGGRSGSNTTIVGTKIDDANSSATKLAAEDKANANVARAEDERYVNDTHEKQWQRTMSIH